MTSSFKLLAAVYFLTVAFEICFVNSSQSGYIDIPLTRTLYKYHEEAATWNDANNKCKSEGSQLFHPENLHELKIVIGVLGVSNEYIHSGFRKRRFGSVVVEYRVEDERDLTQVYHTWRGRRKGFSLDTDAECGALFVAAFVLVLGSCDSSKAYICKNAYETTVEDVRTINAELATLVEKATQLVNRTAELEAAKQELQVMKEIEAHASRVNYTYVPSARRWYKFHWESETWQVASGTCRAEGGELFHPDDENELKEVINALKFSFVSSILTGIYEIAAGEYLTSYEGRPVSEVYNIWDLKDLDLSYNWHCAELNVGSLTISALPCNSTRQFVCKTAVTDPMATAFYSANATIGHLRTRIAQLEGLLPN